MTVSINDDQQKLLMAAFRMPALQTMVARKSSITNAFVNAVIPVIKPTLHEVGEALTILRMKPGDVRCAYCGDKATEWDHLRPLVVDRRPTGHVSEIANLVPSCGKCNQSKGNKPWLAWMRSNAKWSPTGRGISGIQERIELLEKYEQWQTPTHVDFQTIVGPDKWEHYWSLCEEVNNELREAQQVADVLRTKILGAIRVEQ